MYPGLTSVIRFTFATFNFRQESPQKCRRTSRPFLSLRQWWKKNRSWLRLKLMSLINRSGQPRYAVEQFYKIDHADILLGLDDLALPLGRIRIRPDGGTGGHNGLESIIVQFGTEEIPRLRIGIGTAPRDGGVDYVLGRFFEEERPLVKSAIERSVEAIKCAVDNGVVSAMNTFNQIQEP